jgi:ribonuclease HI
MYHQPAKMSEGGEGVSNRRMGFCKTLLSKFNTDELYVTCNRCYRFHCVCCSDFSNDILCHHYPVVFTDGACSANGSRGATSGIGGAYGEQAEHQWSIPVDDLVDANPVRTNQRAELLAAIEGVRRLGDFILSSNRKPARNGCKAEMVVATDSEYICKGVTEWMPKWKVSLPFFHRRYLLGYL